MNTIKRLLFGVNLLILTILASCSRESDYVGLSLIPPGTITDKVDLDVRTGIVNKGTSVESYNIYVYLGDPSDDNLLLNESVTLNPGENHQSKYILETEGMVGKNEVSLKIVTADGKEISKASEFEVVKSDIRSTRLIDGAWAGLYHWSEEEGKLWNKDIKELKEDQWRDLVKSMHAIGMDVIVIQEVFRNNDYVGQHQTTVENYQGRAFYPSELYPGRMPIASKDPLEAILS